MAYASVADVRAEGLTVDVASDVRVTALLAEATEIIDRACGWWFEARTVSFTQSGPGGQFMDLPVPAISLTGVTVDDEVVDPTKVLLLGTPFGHKSKLKRIDGYFRRGIENITLSGSFGVLVNGATPAAIKRAAIMLVVKHASKLATQDAVDDRVRSRVISETTRDQSYTLAPLKESATGVTITGDVEIDEVLRLWRRPMMIGSV